MFVLPLPVPAIEFNLSSTGMSKGLAQTDGAQALIRGELGFGHLYVGAYAKNVKSSSADGEAAALVGSRTSLAGFDFDATAAWKRAINPAPGSDVNALEIAVFASRRFGPVTPRVSVTWSPDDVGSTGRTVFTELGAIYRLTKILSASAAVSRRERSGGLDYTAWNAGLAFSPIKPLIFDARYYDSDGGNERTFKGRFVASGRLKF